MLMRRMLLFNSSGTFSRVEITHTCKSSESTHRIFIDLAQISRGRIALSPQQDMLATTNLIDGIDWYSIESQRHIGSTRYDIKAKDGSVRVVGIDFVDNNTVVAGHPDGGVVLARPTMNSPVRFDFEAENKRPGDSSRQSPFRA